VALYVAMNLTERATLSAFSQAVHDDQLELIVASPGGATSHILRFSGSE
jgi:hypothetical protein